jgi:hypothetical protein
MIDTTEEVYSKTWGIINELSAEYDPLVIAGVLAAQALTIYKTVLSDSEYESMVDRISDTRDKVKKLKTPEIQ